MTRLIVVARNDSFPALNHSAQCSSPRASGNARGNLARSHIGNAAPLFDATHDVWIIPPSGMTPVAGAAADLRHATAQHSSRRGSSLECDPAASPSLAAGRLETVVDVLTTALGLTVFGLIAGFFLVMA